MGFLLFPIYGLLMGLRLAALRAAGAPLLIRSQFSLWLNCYEMLSCYYIPLTNRARGPYRKLRTEFFSSSIYGLSAKRAGHKSKGKKRGSVTYSTDRENEASTILIISLVCVWGAQERFLFTRNGFKFLTHLESNTNQFEIVFMSLALSNTQFRV